MEGYILKIKGWVYYVPERETLCIVFPDWWSDEGNTPVEWDGATLYKYKNEMFLDARPNSKDRNCYYIGDL